MSVTWRKIEREGLDGTYYLPLYDSQEEKSVFDTFWRRLWFLVSAIPRYLISGSIEVP